MMQGTISIKQTHFWWHLTSPISKEVGLVADESCLTIESRLTGVSDFPRLWRRTFVGSAIASEMWQTGFVGITPTSLFTSPLTIQAHCLKTKSI
jgi:hypothetical protein